MLEDKFSWTVRIRIKQKEDILFGSGVCTLLAKTQQHGSLHAAAKEMQMSYRKALAIIRRIETAWAQPLLKKAIGGAGGGGSELTTFAQLLVTRFSALEGQVSAYTGTLTTALLADLKQDASLSTD